MKHIVDLQTVLPSELEELWQREDQLWRERLFWDVSDRIAMLRRVFARRGVQGVALRIGRHTVGYAYYVVSGRLGVLAGLDLARDGAAVHAGPTLLYAAIQALRQHDVTRIESPFVSFDSTWLTAAFEAEGFRTYWREFLRLHLNAPPKPLGVLPSMHLEPLQRTHLSEAAEIMHAAYEGGVDAEMSLLYRTVGGCHLVLDHILHQQNSGVPINQASAFVRHGGQGVGFIVITEIARQQGHLAQVVVLPAYQRQGVARWLVNYSLAQLASLKFDTLSLIVSHDNTRALRLYQNMGFQSVLAFPVFVWEPPASLT